MEKSKRSITRISWSVRLAIETSSPRNNDMSCIPNNTKILHAKQRSFICQKWISSNVIFPLCAPLRLYESPLFSYHKSDKGITLSSIFKWSQIGNSYLEWVNVHFLGKKRKILFFQNGLAFFTKHQQFNSRSVGSWWIKGNKEFTQNGEFHKWRYMKVHIIRIKTAKLYCYISN